MFHKNKMGSIVRSNGKVFYSLLYLNFRPGYMYSVISVIVNSLPDNSINREWTRSWTARVRLFHPWAVSHEVVKVLINCSPPQSCEGTLHHDTKPTTPELWGYLAPRYQNYIRWGGVGRENLNWIRMTRTARQDSWLKLSNNFRCLPRETGKVRALEIDPS